MRVFVLAFDEASWESICATCMAAGQNLDLAVGDRGRDEDLLWHVSFKNIAGRGFVYREDDGRIIEP